MSLKAVTLVRQWHDDSVAKIGGKIFCLLDRDDGEIWLKVPDASYAIMTDMPGIRPAPYFARAGWVAISPHSDLGDADIRAYIALAHGLVAARLSTRQRLALGLVDQGSTA